MNVRSGRGLAAALILAAGTFLVYVVASSSIGSNRQAGTPHIVQSEPVPVGAVPAPHGWQVGYTTLVRVTPRQLSVRNTYGRSISVPLAASTRVCRGRCGHSSASLRPGDRIDALVHFTRDGQAQAVQVDANGAAGMAVIEAVEGQTLVVVDAGHPRASQAPFQVLVEPYTVFRQVTPTGQRVARTLDARVGDFIQYIGSTETAVADSPIHASVVITGAIH